MRFRVNREFTIGIISVLLGLLAGGILMLLTGNNPIEGYGFLFAGGLMNLERLGNTLAMATPLILTGLSVAFAFRTGLFNIGTPGQVLVGGLVATVIGLTVDLPRPALISLMTLSALLAGAVWGVVPGLLKARFNVHEVVSGIMMNWIAYWITYYLVPAYFKGSFRDRIEAYFRRGIAQGGLAHFNLPGIVHQPRYFHRRNRGHRHRDNPFGTPYSATS